MISAKMKIQELDTITFEVKMSGLDAVHLIALQEEIDKGGYQFDVKLTDSRQAFHVLCGSLRIELEKVGMLE